MYTLVGSKIRKKASEYDRDISQLQSNQRFKIRNSIFELQHNKVTVLSTTRKYAKNYNTKQ